MRTGLTASAGELSLSPPTILSFLPRSLIPAWLCHATLQPYDSVDLSEPLLMVSERHPSEIVEQLQVPHLPVLLPPQVFSPPHALVRRLTDVQEEASMFGRLGAMLLGVGTLFLAVAIHQHARVYFNDRRDRNMRRRLIEQAGKGGGCKCVTVVDAGARRREGGGPNFSCPRKPTERL
eukprot:419525-Hanusia_phi.AAC.2